MTRSRYKGKVYLVGAGPGDPALLTLRGAQVLKSADAVVYDRLVNPLLLKFAARAEKIFAGKDPASRHCEDVQEKILSLSCVPYHPLPHRVVEDKVLVVFSAQGRASSSAFQRMRPGYGA